MIKRISIVFIATVLSVRVGTQEKATGKTSCPKRTIDLWDTSRTQWHVSASRMHSSHWCVRIAPWQTRCTSLSNGFRAKTAMPMKTPSTSKVIKPTMMMAGPFTSVAKQNRISEKEVVWNIWHHIAKTKHPSRRWGGEGWYRANYPNKLLQVDNPKTLFKIS